MSKRTIAFKHISTALLLAASMSQFAYAGTTNEANSRQTVELSFLVGELETGLSEQVFNEDDAKHYRLSYDYQFDNGIYLGAGYLDGESGELSPLDDLFNGNELVYDAILLNAGYRHSLSPKQALYFEVSAVNYDTDLSLNGDVISDDGTSMGFSTGWRFRLDNGVGFKVGLEYLQLGSDMDIQSIGGGLSYNF